MKLFIVLFSLWLLSACENIPVLSPSSSDTDEPKADIQVQIDERTLDISFLNKNSQEPLSLSSEILFSGFSESGLFDNDKEEEKRPGTPESSPTEPKMKISGICVSKEGGKFVKDISLNRYKFQFTVMDLIPYPIFFQEEGVSCSFVFVVTDETGREHHFSLRQQALTSLGENKSLTLSDSSGKELSVLENKVIGPEDIDNFFLTNANLQPKQTIFLLCSPSHKMTPLQSDNLAVPAFRLVQAAQNSSLQGVQACRFLSQKNKKLIGVTKVFQVDLSAIDSKTPSLKLEDLKLTLHHGPHPLFQPGKWRQSHGNQFVETEEFKSIKNSLVPKDDQPHINSVFKVSGLPEDFLQLQYAPVKIRVETQCIGDFFPNQVIDRTFHLNLTPDIPLMRVTPEEVFQMKYLKNRKMEGTGKVWPTLYSDALDYLKSAALKPSMDCSYLFHFQDLKTKEEWSHPSLSYDIQWDGGGMGIAYDHPDLSKGAAVFYEELLSEGAGAVLFAFKKELPSQPPHLQNYLLPDSAQFKCGDGLSNFHRERKAPHPSLPLEGEIPFSLPVSVFLNMDGVRKHIRYRALKCRLLLYRGNVLLYFSPEVQLVSEAKTRSSVRILNHFLGVKRTERNKHLYKDYRIDFFFVL